jgi:cytochrome oxidase Cu insertion factor (SCO1/SenC/PrrC family)
VGKRFDSSFLIGMAAGVAATLILLIVAAAGLAFAYPSLRKAAIAETEKNLEAPPLPGTVQADFNWQLTALDGTSLSLESLEGDVIFVTFWSPECPY